MSKQQIISILQKHGPSLPGQISTTINTSILLASAMLSELVDSKDVKLSTLKIGSSPLYYLKGQEEQLEAYIEKLNSKQKEAVFFLKEKQVVQNSSLEPAIRVAMYEVKDFAKPIQITINDKILLFWRWHMLSQEETEPYIKKILQKTEPQRLKKEQEPVLQKKEQQKEQIIKTKTQQSTPQKRRTNQRDVFLEQITAYFREEQIQIEEKLESRKNKMHEFIVVVPGKLGKVRYYCLAKNKKKISEQDIHVAFSKSQQKKLPAFLLSTGVVDKETTQTLTTDLNIHFKQLGTWE